MKPPLIRRTSLIHRHGERGVTMALVAIAMVAIIAMAALSVDVVTLYLAREEAQRSADAAAVSAASYLSLSGVTGDPSNIGPPPPWPTVCATATQIAKAVALENPIAGGAPLAGNVTVNFVYNGASSVGCTNAGGTGAFAINPQVQVLVQRPGLPTLFSRIWSRAPNSVSATATAEAYNPSNSASVSPGGGVVPVQPRCVKPWMIPNVDPGNFPNAFVAPGAGTIQNPGIFNTNGGVIGESFTLFADCDNGTNCGIVDNPLVANAPKGKKYNNQDPPSLNNLEYLPGYINATSVAVPFCSTNNNYQEAIGGCDQTTVYQCGVSVANGGENLIDASENPGGAGGAGGSGDTALGAACLLTNNATLPIANQDSLNTTSYPFVITAGSANPQVTSGTQITTSRSIVTMPIYDVSGGGGTITLNGKNQAPVTIVGFLQVFINGIDPTTGNLNVTVLNVAGCGNAVPTNPTVGPILGSSPVPVRLITPQ